MLRRCDRVPGDSSVFDILPDHWEKILEKLVEGIPDAAEQPNYCAGCVVREFIYTYNKFNEGYDGGGEF